MNVHEIEPSLIVPRGRLFVPHTHDAEVLSRTLLEQRYIVAPYAARAVLEHSVHFVPDWTEEPDGSAGTVTILHAPVSETIAFANYDEDGTQLTPVNRDGYRIHRDEQGLVILGAYQERSDEQLRVVWGFSNIAPDSIDPNEVNTCIVSLPLRLFPRL